MEIVLIIIGIIFIFLGAVLKIGGNKPIGQLTAGEGMKAGCSGYFKMMMIVGGIVLIIIGIIIKLL
jgi:hypothetical protein